MAKNKETVQTFIDVRIGAVVGEDKVFINKGAVLKTLQDLFSKYLIVTTKPTSLSGFNNIRVAKDEAPVLVAIMTVLLNLNEKDSDELSTLVSENLVARGGGLYKDDKNTPTAEIIRKWLDEKPSVDVVKSREKSQGAVIAPSLPRKSSDLAPVYRVHIGAESLFPEPEKDEVRPLPTSPKQIIQRTDAPKITPPPVPQKLEVLVKPLLDDARARYDEMMQAGYDVGKAELIARDFFFGLTDQRKLSQIASDSGGAISPTALSMWRNFETYHRHPGPDTLMYASESLAKTFFEDEAQQKQAAHFLAGIPWGEKKLIKQMLDLAREKKLDGPTLLLLDRRQKKLSVEEYALSLGLNRGQLATLMNVKPEDAAKYRGNEKILSLPATLGLIDSDDLADMRLVLTGQSHLIANRPTQKTLAELCSSLKPEDVRSWPEDFPRQFLELLQKRHGLHDRGEVVDLVMDNLTKKLPEGEGINARRKGFKTQIDNITKESGGIRKLPEEIANWLAAFAFPSEEERPQREFMANYFTNRPDIVHYRSGEEVMRREPTLDPLMPKPTTNKEAAAAPQNALKKNYEGYETLLRDIFKKSSAFMPRDTDENGFVDAVDSYLSGNSPTIKSVFAAAINDYVTFDPSGISFKKDLQGALAAKRSAAQQR